MENFIQENKVKKVVSGERLTPQNEPALNREALEISDRARYCLEGGKEFILTKDDINSAPNYELDWRLD
jgi:hypothetical protein